MRHVLRIFGTAGAVLLTMSLGAQPSDERRMRDAAAEEGLTILVELAVNHSETIGLSINEAMTARLLPPLSLHVISLDRLGRFGRNDNPQSLLDEAQTVWYPIVIENEIRALMGLQKREGVWVATEFGSASRARRIGQLRTVLPDATRVVFIPALDAYYLARAERGTMRMASLSEADTAPAVVIDAAKLFLSISTKVRTQQR